MSHCRSLPPAAIDLWEVLAEILRRRVREQCGGRARVGQVASHGRQTYAELILELGRQLSIVELSPARGRTPVVAQAVVAASGAPVAPTLSRSLAGTAETSLVVGIHSLSSLE